LEVDPASKWTFKIAGFPVAVALDQHYLRSLQLDKNKAVLRPLICEPKTKNIAPERFALGQIKYIQFRNKRRETTSRQSIG